jgi:hypothetical protein
LVYNVYVQSHVGAVPCHRLGIVENKTVLAITSKFKMVVINVFLDILKKKKKKKKKKREKERYLLD